LAERIYSKDKQERYSDRLGKHTRHAVGRDRNIEVRIDRENRQT
jgi:hypothetical protein